MKVFSIRFLVVYFMAILVFFQACENDGNKEGKKLPSEIQSTIDDSVMTLFAEGKIENREQINSIRDKISAGLIDLAINDPDSLTDEEYLNYAKLLDWAGRDQEASKIFNEYRKREGKEARKALSSLITMETENGNLNRAENLISEFRECFCKDQKNRPGIYQKLEELSGRYNDDGRPEDAARVIMEELNSLECVYPHFSYYLIGELMPLMVETDRIQEYLDIASAIRKDLEGAFKAHVDTMVYGDTLSLADDDVRQDYEMLINNYDNAINQINYIGNRAPAINQLHVYNADSTFSLSSLKGKVVILDFWSACCIPCRVGYKEMRRLLEEYQDRGLEVVGVTCLLGMFPGVETEKTPGGRRKKLDRRREIELNASYIEEYNITWPCIMSSQNIFDKEYSISAIPTMFILDRDLKVRFISSGIGGYPQLKRIVEDVL